MEVNKNAIEALTRALNEARSYLVMTSEYVESTTSQLKKFQKDELELLAKIQDLQVAIDYMQQTTVAKGSETDA